MGDCADLYLCFLDVYIRLVSSNVFFPVGLFPTLILYFIKALIHLVFILSFLLLY